MAAKDGAVGTGFGDVDAALGGLITGDNVVWLGAPDELYATLAAGFVGAASAAARPGLVVAFGARRLTAIDGAIRLDASAGGPFPRAVALADEIERRVVAEQPSCLVIDNLAAVERRWGTDALAAFFARICPSMLDAGVTAYWSIDPGLGRGFVEHVRQITQCLLDVRGARLRVLKAEGRPEALQDISYRMTVTDDRIELTSPPAGGRLARGLAAVRQQHGLNQHELAVIAGVTPSAISQAESGVRGLSLDTVVTIADRLEIPVDRILAAAEPRGYRLARHDRTRRLAGGQVAALSTDTASGLRVYLVDLAGGEQGEPPFAHRGVSTVAAARGLIQVELDADRPVLRGGDVLIVETGEVRAWRNLRAQRAQAFWVVRD